MLYVQTALCRVHTHTWHAFIIKEMCSMKIKDRPKICCYDFARLLFREICTSTQRCVHTSLVSRRRRNFFMEHCVTNISTCWHSPSYSTPINNLTRHYYERALRYFARHILHVRRDAISRFVASLFRIRLFACVIIFIVRNVMSMWIYHA